MSTRQVDRISVALGAVCVMRPVTIVAGNNRTKRKINIMTMTNERMGFHRTERRVYGGSKRCGYDDSVVGGSDGSGRLVRSGSFNRFRYSDRGFQ